MWLVPCGEVCDYLNGVDMFQVSVKMMEWIKFNTYDAFNHESEQLGVEHFCAGKIIDGFVVVSDDYIVEGLRLAKRVALQIGGVSSGFETMCISSGRNIVKQLRKLIWLKLFEKQTNVKTLWVA